MASHESFWQRYRTLPSKQGGASTGVFRAVLIANCVQQIGKDHIESTKVTDRDVRDLTLPCLTFDR